MSKAAANLYTSGQFFGALFVMLLGTLIVTNEFSHQTATTTFLTTPHRTAVILGKLIAGVAVAAFFWLITTVLNVIAGAVFLSTQDRCNASATGASSDRSCSTSLRTPAGRSSGSASAC